MLLVISLILIYLLSISLTTLVYFFFFLFFICTPSYFHVSSCFMVLKPHLSSILLNDMISFAAVYWRKSTFYKWCKGIHLIPLECDIASASREGMHYYLVFFSSPCREQWWLHLACWTARNDHVIYLPGSFSQKLRIDWSNSTLILQYSKVFMFLIILWWSNTMWSPASLSCTYRIVLRSAQR